MIQVPFEWWEKRVNGDKEIIYERINSMQRNLRFLEASGQPAS